MVETHYATIDAGVIIVDLQRPPNPAASFLEDGDYWSPYFSLAKEGVVSVFAEVGTTPFGASIDQALIGRLAATKEVGDVVFEGTAYRRGRRDSIVSFVGSQDFPGEVAFGRVIETGGEVAFRQPIAESVTLGARGGASSLDGKNTTSNTKLEGSVHLTREVPIEGFLYLNTGPFIQYQTYNRNLNAYSTGYGGYFSPQVFARSGWLLNFMTDELQDSLYRGDVSAAYQQVDEDPLYNSSPGLTGASSAAFSGSIDLAAGFRLSDKWIVSAHVSGIASTEFDDFQAAFAFKYTPGGRAGLVRGDLDPDPFAADVWGR